MALSLVARRGCGLASLGLALLALGGGCGTDTITGGNGSFARGTSLHSLAVQARTRSYLLHVPAKRPTTSGGLVRSWSLVIVLHGSSGSAQDMRSTTRLDSLSETGRFVAVYASGIQGGGGLFPSDWNAGNCCGAAGREQVDDVGYIKAVIAELSSALPIDAKRVYVVGFSDGGRMAYRLGCELSSQLAAIAVVSGSLTESDCVPARPVALLAIHGTADAEVAYDEPAGSTPARAVPASGATLPPSVQFWLAANGCAAVAISRPSPDVARSVFAPCSGAEVNFYSIGGGAHGWPGDPGGVGSRPPMSELRASVVITQFFARQYRK